MPNRRKHFVAMAVYQDLLAADEQARARGDALLTDSGIHRLSRLVAAARAAIHPAALAPPGIRPDWDADRRRLSLGGEELHQFVQEAERETCLLAAFQAAGWPDHPIPNPFPAEHGDTPEDLRHRLYDAVKNLNANLPDWTIWFRVRRNHVYWERCPLPGRV